MPNRILTLGSMSYKRPTKVVGYIQIAFGASQIFLMVYFGLSSRIYDSQGIPEDFWMFSIPTAGISICSMCMGLLLLDSIHNKGLLQCRIWLVIATTFLFISLIGFSLALETEELIALELKASMALGMFLVIYMNYVVASYYKTLKSELSNLPQCLPETNTGSIGNAEQNHISSNNEVSGKITIKMNVNEPHQGIFTISSPQLDNPFSIV